MKKGSLQEFIETRLKYLDIEESKINKERSRLRKALKAVLNCVQVDGEEEYVYKDIDEETSPRLRRGEGATIKQKVVQILKEYPNGLTSREILFLLNEKYTRKYYSGSLSPQLSRLRDSKVIILDKGIWSININKNGGEV